MSRLIQHRIGPKECLEKELDVAVLGYASDTKEMLVGDGEGAKPLAMKEDIPSIDGLETVAGAQEKADTAEQNAKNYADEQIENIDFDTSDLATKAELNNKQDKLTISSAVNSTSATQVANSNAVKQAYDRADAAFTQANDGKTAVVNALTAKGVPASPSDTFSALADKIGQINAGLSDVTAGDNIIFVENKYIGNLGVSETNVYKKVLEYKSILSGSLRVSYKAKFTLSGGVYLRIHVNDEPVGIERTITSIETEYVEDITIGKGDFLQFFMMSNNTSRRITFGDLRASINEIVLEEQ